MSEYKDIKNNSHAVIQRVLKTENEREDFTEEEIDGFYINDIYIGGSNAPGTEPTTIDEVLSILANLKKEAMSTTDKTRLSDLLGRLNKIDNWYFNYPETNIKVGQLIRDIKRIIKDKL